MHDYDRSSKWLIQHYGASIPRLAGIVDIVEWEALHPEVVQPRGLPDGFLKARRAYQSEPGLYVVEVVTYPEPRIAEQVVRDAALVYLDRGIIPEVIVLVLRQRGRQPAPRMAELQSESGRTSFHVKWHLIELWDISAEVLLEAEDVGVLPWVSLSRIDGPPEPIFRRCRERILREAPAEERESLMAISQVLARLRYHDETIFELLGGRKAMLELPFLDEIFEELKDDLKAKWVREALEKDRIAREAAEKAAREAAEKVRAAREAAEKAAREAAEKADHAAVRRTVVDFLSARFGEAAERLRKQLDAIDDGARLGEFVKLAASCKNLAEFRKHLRVARP